MNTLPVQQRISQNTAIKPVVQPRKSIDVQRFIADLRAFVESEDVVKSLTRMVEKNIVSMAKMQSPVNILNAELGSFTTATPVVGAASGFGAPSPLANTQGAHSDQGSDKAAPSAAEPQNIVLSETTEKKPRTSRWFKMAEMNTHILSESSILNTTATKDLFSLDSAGSEGSTGSGSAPTMPSLKEGGSAILKPESAKLPSMSGSTESVLNVAMPDMNATPLSSTAPQPLAASAQSTSAFSLSIPQMMGSVGASTATPSTVSSSPTIPQMMGSAVASTTSSTSPAVPQMMGVTNTGAQAAESTFSIAVPSFGLDSSVTQQSAPRPIDDAKAVTLPSLGLDEPKATMASLNDFFKLK